MKFTKPFLILMIIVWLPWGLQCIFYTPKIADIIGVTSLNSAGVTDIRVMYGGVQFAVGLMAVFTLFKSAYVKNVLFALAFLGSTMALTRAFGMWVDSSAGLYNWGVLAFETFTGIAAAILLRIHSRASH